MKSIVLLEELWNSKDFDEEIFSYKFSVDSEIVDENGNKIDDSGEKIDLRGLITYNLFNVKKLYYYDILKKDNNNVYPDKLIGQSYIYGTIDKEDITLYLDKPVKINKNSDYFLVIKYYYKAKNPNIVTLENPETPVVMHIDFMGAGDHWMCVNLPEIIYKKYNKYTYLSKLNRIRSEDTIDFMWLNNPYVKGFSDLYPNFFPYRLNCPHINGEYYPEWMVNSIDTNIICDVPRIYCDPKIDQSLKDYYFVEFSGITGQSWLYNYEDKMNELVNLIGKPIVCVKYKTQSKYSTNRIYPKCDYKLIEVYGMQDVFDIMCSVKGYIGSLTGAASVIFSAKEYYNTNIDIHLVGDKKALDNYIPHNREYNYHECLF